MKLKGRKKEEQKM